MPMDPERKAEWLQLLRSGEYEQGTKVLKDGNDRYCCLGVACEAALAADVVEYWEVDGYHATDRFYGDQAAWDANRDGVDGSWAGLPAKAMEWLGLEDGDPFVTIPEDHPRYQEFKDNVYIGTRVRLSTLNDNGVTFDEIADLIEAQL